MTPETKARFGRSAALAAVMMAVLLAVLEGLAFIAVEFVFKKRSPAYFAHDYRAYLEQMKEHEIESYVQVLLDPDLGWAFRPNTRRTLSNNTAGETWSMTIDATGARTNPYPASEALISLYGDSVTFADEVNDDQAWGYFLSLLTDSNVHNLAMGAYGTDQAVLRLENDLKAGRGTPIVILGIYAENIKRIMTTYRPYYIYADGHVLGFKPVFAGAGEDFAWIKPRLFPPYDKQAIAQAMNFAAEYDHFFQINRMMPDGRFPYLWSFLKYAIYVFRVDVLDQEHLRRYGGTSDAMWRMPEARERMHALIRRYVRLSKDYAFRPMVVFFPEPQQLSAFLETGKVPQYHAFAKDIESRYGGDGLIVADLIEAPFEPRLFHLAPFIGHPSEYGNKVIASFVYRHLLRIPEIARRSPGTVPPSELAVTGIRRHGINRRLISEADIVPASRCATVVHRFSGADALRSFTPENAAVRLEGDDLVIEARSNDPILFLPDVEGTVERVEVRIESPHRTGLELFVIRDRGGYTAAPYNEWLAVGWNLASIAVRERERLRFRLDPATRPGVYRLREVTLLSGCK